MMLLFALRLFFHNLRKLSLEEICRGVIYELTTISIWGGLGRKGSRGLQMGMATYYLLINGQYIIWLYFNFYRSVELLYYSSTNYNIYSRLQAGEEFTLWQNLLLGDAFPISATPSGNSFNFFQFIGSFNAFYNKLVHSLHSLTEKLHQRCM